MATVKFDERFSPAEATRGQFVPIDSSTLVNYPSGDSQGISRGRYAELAYIVGSEPGALNISLSGGNVILPVSSVNLTEPVAIENDPGTTLDVTVDTPNTTVYSSVTIAPSAISTINFAPAISLLEVFNNDQLLPAYVGFNNVNLQTLSAEALPVVPETFYSVERNTSTVYIGNVDVSSSVDIRVIGHYKV